MNEDVLKINENIENKKDKQIIETNQIIGNQINIFIFVRVGFLYFLYFVF